MRLISLFLNVPGGLALILGALFSAYIFMPKKRVLDYSLDAGQSGDQFLFNLLIAPVAIPVNFFASLPGAIEALFAGKIHSRVPATLLIAIGGIIASSADALSRLGSTDLYSAGQVRRRGLDLRRLPGLDRGFRRDPHAVHRAASCARAPA